MHLLCEKGVKFSWDNESQAAFDSLKEALTTSPILGYPEQGKRFIWTLMLANMRSEQYCPKSSMARSEVIAYMSKAMTSCERVYCVTRNELLAVVSALRGFHSHLT